jgi:hypothetical protein
MAIVLIGVLPVVRGGVLLMLIIQIVEDGGRIDNSTKDDGCFPPKMMDSTDLNMQNIHRNGAPLIWAKAVLVLNYRFAISMCLPYVFDICQT